MQVVSHINWNHSHSDVVFLSQKRWCGRLHPSQPEALRNIFVSSLSGKFWTPDDAFLKMLSWCVPNGFPMKLKLLTVSKRFDVEQSSGEWTFAGFVSLAAVVLNLKFVCYCDSVCDTGRPVNLAIYEGVTDFVRGRRVWTVYGCGICKPQLGFVET